MNLIDTHAHLYYDNYKEDFEEMLDRALAAGVSKIITIGTDLASSEQCLEIAEKYEPVYATAGIHPHDAAKSPANYLSRLEDFYTHPKVVAVGEIGLDYHYNFSEPKKQIRIFREQLELAQSVNLPVVVHNRESDDDLFDSLVSSNNKNGVVHSFSGDIEFAEKLLEIGFLLSFTGMITFVKDGLTDVVQAVDLEKVMIETDAPYLTPKPYRGKRNEPAHVKFIAQKIAELKDISIEEVAEVTSNTAGHFFKKLNS